MMDEPNEATYRTRSNHDSASPRMRGIADGSAESEAPQQCQYESKHDPLRMSLEPVDESVENTRRTLLDYVRGHVRADDAAPGVVVE